MPRAATIQTNGTAGEFSPRMLGRVDINKYSNAVESLENVYPIPQGGLSRRMGTRFIREVIDSTQRGRKVPFEYSTIQTYPLELGSQALRVSKDKGTVFAANVSAEILNGTFDGGLTSWTAASVSASSDTALFASGGTLDQAITITETDTTHIIRFQILGDFRADRVNLRIGSTSGGEEVVSDIEYGVGWHTLAFDPDGNATVHLRFAQSAGAPQLDNVEILDDVPIEITTPWPSDGLTEIKWTQSADVLYVVHPTHPPYEVTRRDDSSWSVVPYEFIDGPYLDVNTSSITMTPAAASGDGVTLTASSAVFEATDVGRLIRIRHGAQWGWAEIKTYSSTTSVTVNIKGNFGGTTAVSDWRLGAWSDTTGWPSAITFFQERLTFGRTQRQPETIWMSVSSDFVNHQPSALADGAVANDDAITVSIADDRVNAIIWFSPGQRLAIGTTNAEFTLSASSAGGTVAPNDIVVQRQTTHGSANVLPIRVGPVVIFLQRQGKKVREFSFTFQLDQFSAPDLTIMADHITGGGLTEMYLTQEPYSIAWMVREDGALLGMTYERDQEVVGFHRHFVGGVSDEAGTPAVIESMCVVPGEDQDEIWLIVRRWINGETKRYIEIVEDLFDPLRNPTETLADAFFVDSGLSYNGAPTSTITGLSHLEGETVAILGDGAVVPPQTVSGGQITLPAPVSVAQVGLPYRSLIKTLRPDAGAADGTAQGKKKKIHQIVLRLFQSLGMKFGASEDLLDEVTFRSLDDPMDQGPDLFTGDLPLDYPGAWETEGQLVLVQDQPLPMNVIAIVKRLIESDG